MPGREVQVEVVDGLAVPGHPDAVGGDLGDVDAGLEGAPLPGVDDDPHPGVAVELDPRVGELVAHVGVHRVELLRPIVDEPADGSVPLDEEMPVAHGDVGVIVQRGARCSAKARGPSSWSG